MNSNATRAWGNLRRVPLGMLRAAATDRWRPQRPGRKRDCPSARAPAVQQARLRSKHLAAPCEGHGQTAPAAPPAEAAGQPAKDVGWGLHSSLMLLPHVAPSSLMLLKTTAGQPLPLTGRVRAGAWQASESLRDDLVKSKSSSTCKVGIETLAGHRRQMAAQ